jgi:hypothetical protein
MINVYLRHRNEVSGEYLGEFSVEELPKLVESIKENSVYFEEEEKNYYQARGEYVNDGTPIYFEIIVW